MKPVRRRPFSITPPSGNGRTRAAHHERLLVVRLGFGVALAVVEAGVDVAVVAGEVVVTGDAGVGRTRQTGRALGEDRPLEAVAIDALGVVDVRRLLHAEADPRALRRPVVEVELRVRVLEAEELAAAQRRRRCSSRARRPA